MAHRLIRRGRAPQFPSTSRASAFTNEFRKLGFIELMRRVRAFRAALLHTVTSLAAFGHMTRRGQSCAALSDPIVNKTMNLSGVNYFFRSTTTILPDRR